MAAKIPGWLWKIYPYILEPINATKLMCLPIINRGMNIAARAQRLNELSQIKGLCYMPNNDFAIEWLRYAANDLIVARHSFEDLYPKQTEIAAYLCQQCAEKALKAFLVFNDSDPPKIHNLKRLRELCQNIDSDFSELTTDCERLDPYGSVTRYPNELAVDETVAKAVIERAQKVYDFCIAKLPAQDGTP
jgi:HEPN domain-containing protein